MKRPFASTSSAAFLLRASSFAIFPLIAGCAGYNLSLGTSADGAAFYQVFEVPATSLRPWTERNRPVNVPPPPDGGPSGVTTLPAGSGSAAAMPPEKS